MVQLSIFRNQVRDEGNCGEVTSRGEEACEDVRKRRVCGIATRTSSRQSCEAGRGDGNRFTQVFILRSDQDGDGKISKKEFRGPAFGFDRMDKNKNGFIEADELGELHQRRLNDPKSMRERLESGDVPKPPQGKRPEGLGEADPKKQ